MKEPPQQDRIPAEANGELPDLPPETGRRESRKASPANKGRDQDDARAGLPPRGQAMYEGKPASYWVKALRDAANNRDFYNEAKHAADALEAIGPAANDLVPELISLLAFRHGKKNVSGDTSSMVRDGAARALGAIGPEARAAVGPLINAMSDDVSFVRTTAAKAIGRVCGKGTPLAAAARPNSKDISKAVGALAKALKDDDNNMRSTAAESLSLIGPEAKDALPALIQALHTTDTLPLIKAFASIGDPAVPELAKALEDRSPEIRRNAALALRQMGPMAKSALPALSKAAKDKDSVVRGYAEDALRSIQSPPKPDAPLELTARRTAKIKEYIKANTGDPGSLEFQRIDVMPGKWLCLEGSLVGRFDAVYVKYRAKNNFGAMQVFETAVLFLEGEVQGNVPPRLPYLISEAQNQKNWDDLFNMALPNR